MNENVYSISSSNTLKNVEIYLWVYLSYLIILNVLQVRHWSLTFEFRIIFNLALIVSRYSPTLILQRLSAVTDSAEVISNISRETYNADAITDSVKLRDTLAQLQYLQ